MERYGSPHHGLDHTKFWGAMERCFAEALAAGPEAKGITPQEELIPEIELEPPPAEWPDPAPFLDEE
jgi:hypothetical protein